jgi:hypothetical protein
MSSFSTVGLNLVGRETQLILTAYFKKVGMFRIMYERFTKR